MNVNIWRQKKPTMKLNKRYIYILFFTIVVIVSFISQVYAQPPAPTGLTAVNIGGPIQLSWTASVGATQYMLYRSTATITDLASDIVEVAGISTSTSFIDINTEDLTTYRYVATAWNAAGEESLAFSNEAAATAFYAMLEVTLDATDSIIDFESNGTPASTTISWTVNNGYLAESIQFDIIDNATDQSIFDEPRIYASASGITNGSFVWDGSWYNTATWIKHNGGYTVEVIPTGFDGSIGVTSQLSITVNVVHFNDIVITHTDRGESPFHHGQPFLFTYQMTSDSFITLRIYDTNDTETTSDDTLIKTIIHETPRDDESLTRDFRVQEIWEGRDDSGNIVGNDVYRYQFNAIEYRNNPATDTAVTRSGHLAFDVLRILDLRVTGISADNAEATISYTLTDDATVKIQICEPGTTFSLDANGEPQPSPSTNLLKTFSFSRSAGANIEVWDGMDENGVVLDNKVYVFAISATDTDNNHAIDNSGNDQPIVGSIPVDRTASQVASDGQAPIVTTVTPSNGSTVTTAFTHISAVLQDEAGGSGLDLENSTITLTDPNGTVITDTKSDNGVDTLLLTFSAQSGNGTYTIRVIPQDKAGNTGSPSTSTFTLNLTASGQQVSFKETVYVYPNPVNTGKAMFAYNLVSNAVVTIKIYNMMGELVYSDRKNDTSGVKTWDWNCVNESGNFVGSGLYIYTLTAFDGTSTFEAVKKLVIIR